MGTRSGAGRLAATVALVGLTACRSVAPPPAGPAAGSGDAAFTALASEILEDSFRRHPTNATDLGIHKYDAEMDQASQQRYADESAALSGFLKRLTALDPATLSFDQQLDYEQLIRAMKAGILSNDVIRQWTLDPDVYSGGVTRAAYVIMKRKFAPPADRLKSLIAREQKMPAFLDEGRKNLANPARIFTEIAIEQIDGNIKFFKDDVTAAFAEVTDKPLLAAFAQSNKTVMEALASYKTFLQKDLLSKSQGAIAIGADTYAKALSANEMIELPLDDLLRIAEADRQRNETAFQSAAKAIDASKPADQVLASIETDHPSGSALLKNSQDALDAIRQFILDKKIITIPPSDPATVKETPPFRRSTTSASMDIPGPFETAKLEAFYFMTLPDPRATPAAQEEFLRSWYYPAIANVSVHEVYPGHYTQFLYAATFPSDVRKVYGAATNTEGWAHYAEQMMIDEGFHAGDPRYRLAQVQDALLRDVRFLVGIKLHTRGMTIDEATRLFETLGHQPHPVAVLEAKRGAGDPLYGYYTMGKLMILKLREDYKTKTGAAYSLQRFHDAFIKLGPLPLPLIRKAMLGSAATGSLF
jgi:uncharacterized protein (DUF885 family)